MIANIKLKLIIKQDRLDKYELLLNQIGLVVALRKFRRQEQIG